MGKEIKLNRLRSELVAVDYPISKAEAADALAEVTLVYADGAEALSAVIERSNQGTFDAPDDLEAEVMGHVPIGAVGEPGQSEGEG